MSMLLRLELKKTLLAPVLIGFVALCILLNATIVSDLFAGHVYDYAERKSDPYNVFEGYDASAIADSYIAKYGMSGKAERNMRDKYDKLQGVIDEKSANGDALSVYFGQGTYQIHELLFGYLLFAIIAESGLISLFAALMSTGYENTHNTEQIVCASKTGRKILWTKLTASLITGIAAFTLILAVSLAVFFTHSDYSDVWNDNVSSAFNFAYGEYDKPFITWRSFTVAGYLQSEIAAGAGLTLIFSLFGFAVGTFFRNGYVSCGTALLLCVLQFVLPFLFHMGGTVRGALNLMPVMLWFNSPLWFTDGGAGIIWANFECVGLVALLAIFTTAGVIAVKIYNRRDLL